MDYIKVSFRAYLFIFTFVCMSIDVDVIMAFEVEFPHGTPPSAPMVDVQGGPMNAAVLMPDASFLTRPNVFGEQIPERPGYLDILSAYDKTADGEYYLLKWGENSWGWMKNDEILTSSVCLRSEKKHNPAFLKVVAKNNWRLKEGIIEEVPILNGPGKNYEVVGQINIYKIRYAFKKVKGKDGKSYIFVGCEPTWEPDQDWVKDVLTGWILRDHCILWDNQVGVYFDKTKLPEREPVPVFRTQKDLMNYLEGGVKKNVVGEEEAAFIELSSDTTRFPILDHNKDMMEIAWVGDALQVGDTLQVKEGAPPLASPPKKTVKREEIDKQRGNINQVIDMTRRVDVLILIDSTRSMEPAFKPVANGIASFMNSQNERDKNRFRFAFGVYRDLVSDDGGDFELKCNFDFGDVKKIIVRSASGAYSDRRDGTLEESVYRGIHKGVTKANWGKGHIRAVVVVGDHKNHEPPRDEFTKERVVQLLKDKGVSFYSLNIEHWESFPRLCKGFRQQMNSILSLNGDHGKTSAIRVARFVDTKEISRETKKFLNDAMVFSTEVSQAIRDISEGGETIEDTRRKYGIRVTQYVVELMRKHGWEEEDIRLTKFNQFCSDGWVSKKSRNGIKQIEPFCLIRRDNFDNLVGLLGTIHVQTSRRYNRKIDRLIKDACESATGDKILDNETLSEYIQRTFHIPFREISEVLHYSPKELKDKMKDNSFRREFNKEIGRKWEKLHYVAESKDGKLVFDEDTNKWRKGTSKFKDWWFVTSAGLNFCWLPFEYLP